MEVNGMPGMDTGIKVLVVDDMVSMRRIIRNLLKEIGFEHVDEAENGKQGLEKLRGAQFGLVISDWNMPVMDGLTMLKEIRTDPALAKTPVLMATAEAKQENVVAAITAGANNYMVKPFTPAVLEQKLQKVFQKLAAGKASGT